ncbi:transcription termination factor MTERF8, chloroplastic [Macadamia integrifolia]|uniref:transcription termination factor MTERF8, chloroplastic n=1 Tax=Macadamia integrifolia TaxID=60698 RepID=UPI001C532850|nr:transcription termination factor MTERF8, chloroplastic [Macadamia integrifolia]
MTVTLPAISSSPTFFRQEQCCCVSRFSRTTGLPQKPFSAPVCFRASTKLVMIQCNNSSSSSSSNIFTEWGLFLPLFQEFGFEEGQTQVLFEKNPGLRFETLESLGSRLCFLQSAGLDGFALCRLIAKRPDILTAEEIRELYNLKGQIEPVKLERLLTVTEPQYFVGFAGKVELLLNHGIPRENLPHILNNVNLTKVFCHKSANEIEQTILYLKHFGGVDLIIRRPAILNLDFETQLVPRIMFLTELSGGDENATGAVLLKLPSVLAYTTEHLQSHAEFFRSFVGLTDPEIFKIVLVYPNVFSASKDRKLQPRVEFLMECRLNSIDIFRFLIKAPLFLGLSFRENLSKKLVFLLKIGYKYRTKELALALGAVTRTSCENMQKVINVFLTYGLDYSEILAMSKKHPQILQYNCESLQKKVEYLIEDMGREIGELLDFPAFLGYKLDARIKHRYEEKKKIIGEGMSLNKLLSVSTERFSKKKKKCPVPM